MSSQLPIVDLPTSVLVRSPNWLGDAVMAAGAVGLIRSVWPECRLMILCHEKLGPVWHAVPGIDGVSVFPRQASPTQVAVVIRRTVPQLALLFPNSPRSAIEVWLARVPIRVGFGTPLRRVFLTHPVPYPQQYEKPRKRTGHQIRRLLAGQAGPSSAQRLELGPDRVGPTHQAYAYCHLVAHTVGRAPECSPPRLHLAEHELDRFRRKFLPSVHPERIVLGMVPGAEYGSAKRWPADSFAAVAKQVGAKLDCVWVVFGTGAENDLGRYITGTVPNAVNLCGQTDLTDLMAGLSLCRLVLTNDTGPMHLAAALGRPVVALFGSTSPAYSGPVPHPGVPTTIIQSTVPCSPCFRRACPVELQCMRSITPELVARTVLEHMQVA